MDTKAFGRFVGMINLMNNTKISVKDALKDDSLVGLYNKIHSISSKFNKPLTKSSTSRRALDKLTHEGKLGEYQLLVLNAIRDHGKITRIELSETLNLPINTICARVNELLKMNKIYVSGEKFNHRSNRDVECLSVCVLRIAGGF